MAARGMHCPTTNWTFFVPACFVVLQFIKCFQLCDAGSQDHLHLIGNILSISATDRWLLFLPRLFSMVAIDTRYTPDHKLKLKLKHFIGQPWKAALPKYKHIINTHIDTKGNEMRWKHAEGTITLTSGTPWGPFLCSCLARVYIDTRVLI